MFPSVTSRKRPITRSELANISQLHSSSSSFDDSLFLAILLTGFHGLMCLGELTWPDVNCLRGYHKVISRGSLQIFPKSFQFVLPGHKANRFFQGNLVLIQSTEQGNDPYAPFLSYLKLRNRRFPLRAELWLREDGTIPTRGWFLHLLHRYFPGNVGGQCLRAGGATALAEAGVPPHIIQAIGQWSSEAFQIYICRHPALLALLFRRHTALRLPSPFPGFTSSS